MLSTVCVGCTPEADRYQQRIESAESHRSQGRLEQALFEYKRALAVRPEDAEVNLRIARLLHRQLQLGEAVYYYREARRLDPGRLEAYLAEAEILRRADPDLAQHLLDQVLERKPGNVDAHLQWVALALSRADAETAVSAARTAAELAPDRAETHGALGRALFYRARWQAGDAGAPDVALLEQALSAFERAAELHDAGTRWRPLLARAQLLAAWPGREGEAAPAFRAAVESAALAARPSARVFAAESALAYARSAPDPELRQWALEQSLEADDGRLAPWVEIARLEEQAGRSADAVYQRLLARRPQDPAAHTAHAAYLVAHGRGEEAIAHLEARALEGVDPPALLSALLEIQLGLGRRAEAAQIVERLQTTYPDRPETALAEALRALVERRPADAAETLRALVGSREHTEAQRLLALAELRLGRREAALAAIDRAVELERSFAVPVHSLRAEILRASDQCDETLHELGRIEQAARPLSRAERLLRAQCHYETARRAEGRRELEALLAGPAPFVPAALEFAQREARADPARSREVLEAAQAAAPNLPELVRALAGLDFAAGDAPAALARLDATIASRPAPVLLLARARILARLGRLDEAEAAARRALDAAPGLPGAAELLVALYSSRGTQREAIAALEAARRRGSAPPANALVLAGLYQRTGEIAKARALYEEIVASGADLPLAKNNLAYLLATEGVELERAQALAAEALGALPEEPEVLDTLGYLHLRLGHERAAASYLQAAVAAAEKAGQPRAAILYHLGLAQRRLQQNRSAAESFARALALEPDFPEAERARAERAAALAGEPIDPSD